MGDERQWPSDRDLIEPRCSVVFKDWNEFMGAGLAQLLTTIVENAVLLLVALPVLGAIIVRCMGRVCPEAVKATAISNTGLSCVLLLVVLLNFHPAGSAEHQPWQMVSSLRWLGSGGSLSLMGSTLAAGHEVGGHIGITVGVDGAVLPFLLLVAAVAMVAVRLVPDETPRLASRVSHLLIAQAGLVATLTALDAVFLSFATLITAGLLTALIGESGGPDRRPAARRFALTQVASALLVGVAVIGLCIVHWWMSIRSAGAPPLTFYLPRVVLRLPTLALANAAALSVWETMSFALGLLLLVGVLLRVPLAPMHHWFYSTTEQADRGVTALVLVGWMPSGLLLVSRFILPLFTKLVTDLSDRLMLWSGIAATLLALTTLTMTSWPRRMAAYALVGASCAFGCLWMGTGTGQSASLLLSVGLFGSGALGLLLCAAPIEAQPEPSAGMEADRRFDVLNAVVVVGLLGLPLTATFSGSWLLLQDSFRFGSAATKWFLLAFVLMAWSVVDGLSIMRAARNEKVQWLAIWPLLIALLWVGLAPQFVISRLQTQNAAESSETAEAE